MSHTPEDSAISLNAKQEAHLATLVSADEIASYLQGLAVSQQLVTRDAWNPDTFYETEKATHAHQQVTKTIVVDGREITLTADNEAGLLAQENSIYRTGVKPAATTQDQPRNERGQFTAAEQVAANTAKEQLALQFRLGQIDIQTYLERSGAVGDYLAKQGVDVEALPQTSDRQFQQSWAEATEEFLHSEAGATWPGGERNRDLLGKILQSNGLLDAEDKAAAMAEAYAFAKANNLLVDEQGVPLGSRALIDQLYDNAARRSGIPPSPADIRYAMGDRSSIFGSR